VVFLIFQLLTEEPCNSISGQDTLTSEGLTACLSLGRREAYLTDAKSSLACVFLPTDQVRLGLASGRGGWARTVAALPL